MTKKQSTRRLTSKERWRGHNYQRYCVIRGFEQKFLAYFVDPGLGKTTIILQLYKMLKMYGKSKGMIVVAPIRVCYLVWPLEVKKWSNFSHLKINVMHGNKKFLDPNADINIINPDGLPWLYQQLKGKRRANWPFDMLVCDESTMFKNTKSQRFKYIRHFRKFVNRSYILTGTPIPNGYMQLFSQMQIVDQGFSLGTKIGEYRNRHFKQVGKPEWGQYELIEGQDEAINKRIAKFVVRLDAKDHMDLPPLIENKIEIELPAKVMKQYKTLEKEMFLELDGKDVYPPTPASVGQKLHQICNGRLYEDWDFLEEGCPPPSKNRPFFQLHKEKLYALEELINELNGKPLFTAYWYHHDLDAILGHFKNVVVINSKTREKDLVKIERDWNNGKIQHLVAQPAAVAHGLNFQKADADICWYSLIHDYEIYEQFIRRRQRQGMVGQCRNHFLVARGTIDLKMYNRLHEKELRQISFFDLCKEYQKDVYSVR